VIDLDDELAVRAGDPGGMLGTVAAFPEQCREGYRQGRLAAPLPEVLDVSSIAFCGMGGSAVAGDVIRALYADRLPVPVVVVRSSELPEFCGPHSLVLASSYSGGTAEALACFDEAIKRGCRVIAIASGGELAFRAEELELARVTLPGGCAPVANDPAAVVTRSEVGCSIATSATSTASGPTSAPAATSQPGPA